MFEEFYTDFESGADWVVGIKERTIPIAIVCNGEFAVFLSETGKFYGYRYNVFAESPEWFWDYFLC